MNRVFVTRLIPEEGLSLLRSRFDVDVWGGLLPPTTQELIERSRGCHGVLSLLSDTLNGDVMDAVGPQLRAIANFAVGYNNIDIAAAKSRGIAVGNTPDVLTEATADIALGLMLASARHFQASIDQVRRLEWKTWEPLGLLGQELTGKTLGIVGMGRIGQAVAKRCHGGWNMKVLYTSRTVKPEVDLAWGARRVELQELLSSADFISVHTDLNGSTKHLFDAAAFAKMKSSTIFVNTARGGIVDQQALFDALKHQTIFAAGLDVTDPEPLPSDSPLRQLPNCTILPHIGSATWEARNAMSRIAATNLIAALDGQRMPHSVY